LNWFTSSRSNNSNSVLPNNNNIKKNLASAEGSHKFIGQQTMMSWLYCRQAEPEKNSMPQPSPGEEAPTTTSATKDPERGEIEQQQYSEIIVETVTDDEETKDLLPETADTMEGAFMQPMTRSSGVVYMFPRAWKERTSGVFHDPALDEEKQTYASYMYSYCTIS